jgi:hypothetical protein
VLTRLIRTRTEGLNEHTVARLAEAAADRYIGRVGALPVSEHRRLASEVLDEVLRQIPVLVARGRLPLVGARS